MNRGLNYLQDKGRIWLLSSWQLQVFQPTRLGDEITIGTWAYDFRGFYGYRNFIMQNSRGETLAVANSIWVYLDTESGRPMKVPKDTGYPMDPAYPMEYSGRKIEIPEQLSIFPSFPVIKSNIDSYNHVNNGQYIKMAEEYLPEHFCVKSMRVEYRMQAVLGDVITPLVNLNQDICTVILANSAQKPYAVIEFNCSPII
jgi:acyl-ACP thioesterase